MEAFYTQFIQETFDETGQITHWAYTYADNYNYSYDVIDPWGNDVPTVWPCCGGTTGARKNG